MLDVPVVFCLEMEGIHNSVHCSTLLQIRIEIYSEQDLKETFCKLGPGSFIPELWSQAIFPAPAPDFFWDPAPGKNLGSTQKISATTGSGSEKQVVQICLHSAPDFDTKYLKNLNLKKASQNYYFVSKTKKP